MDLFFLPSLFEGLPFVLIEAQCSGVNCLVSDTVTKEAFITDLVTSMKLEDDIKNGYLLLIIYLLFIKIDLNMQK